MVWDGGLSRSQSLAAQRLMRTVTLTRPSVTTRSPDPPPGYLRSVNNRRRGFRSLCLPCARACVGPEMARDAADRLQARARRCRAYNGTNDKGLRVAIGTAPANVTPTKQRYGMFSRRDDEMARS